MKTFLSLAFTLLLMGCASPPSPVSYGIVSAPVAHSRQSDAVELRGRLTSKRADLSKAQTQKEIDELKAEIAALELRLSELEKAMEASNTQTTAPTYGGSRGSGSGTVHTGPRGGRYTITPSGNKSYKKR